MIEIQDYRVFIRAEYEKRRRTQSNYTLSQFAADIGLLPSRLSDILNGKQGLSEKKAEDVALKLGLTQEEKELFLDLVNLRHARSHVLKELARKKLEEREFKPDIVLSEAQFEKISTWHHFAILELCAKYNRWSDVSHISNELGLSESLVREAVGELLELRLLELTPERQFTRKKFYISTTQGQSSSAIQKYHEQIGTRSLEALKKIEFSKRDFTSINIWLTQDQLNEVKNRVALFRKQLIKDFGSFSEESELHAFNFTLFPQKMS